MMLAIDICTYERKKEKSDVRLLLISFVQCQARYIKRRDHREQSEMTLNLSIYPHKTI